VKTLLIILSALLTWSPAQAQERNLEWLAGTWKLKDKPVFEVWEKQASGDLSGMAFRVNGLDTVVTEVIKLQYADGSFHYIPDVAGDQPPVDFLITKLDTRGFVAENPQHDFPKIIRYMLLSLNGRFYINASIEGNGKVISYAFEKIK